MAIDTFTHEIDRLLTGHGFTGELITRDEPTYEEARRVWNGRSTVGRPRSPAAKTRTTSRR